MYYVYSKESIRDRSPICTIDVDTDTNAISYIGNNISRLMIDTTTIYLYKEKTAIYHCVLENGKLSELYISVDRGIRGLINDFVRRMEVQIMTLGGRLCKLDAIKIYDNDTDVIYVDMDYHNSDRMVKKITINLSKLMTEDWVVGNIYYDLIDSISSVVPWNIESISAKKLSRSYRTLSEGLDLRVKFTRYLGDDEWKVAL